MPSEFYASGRPNILVTGGAGFIGSHLTEVLLQHANVISIDNFITGDEHNIDAFLSHPQYEFIRHDLCDTIDLQSLPELKKFKIAVQGIQQIYHLACPTSPKEYRRVPLETLHANAYATRNMLDLARAYQAKILFASSSAVYGEPANDVPIPESWFGYVDPIGPRSPYTEGKRFAEALCWNYRSTFNLDLKIVRIFNTYGPRMKLNDGRLIPDLVSAALTGKPLAVQSHPQATSTFCYINDMTDGLIKVMDAKITQPVNMGSDTPARIRDAAELILKIAGSSSSLQFEPDGASHHKQIIPDIRYARNELNWWPLISLEDGLKKTIEHMRAMAHLYDVQGEQREQ